MKSKIMFFMGIVVLGSFVGCASTQVPQNTSQLQIKVIQLEQRIDERDQVVNELKYEVRELAGQIEELANFTMIEPIEEPSRATTSPKRKSQKHKQKLKKSVKIKKTNRIIRVSVSPKKIQIALKNAGYYTGPIDGRIGGKSQKAISEFQKDHDLKSDGIIGKKTWIELKNYLEG